VNKAHVRNVGDLENFDYPPEQCRTVTRDDDLELFMVRLRRGERGCCRRSGGRYR
jgi:hypothetical protein